MRRCGWSGLVNYDLQRQVRQELDRAALQIHGYGVPDLDGGNALTGGSGGKRHDDTSEHEEQLWCACQS